jgi:predicted RNase H-like nuclease (RuvC/YqgF family)
MTDITANIVLSFALAILFVGLILVIFSLWGRARQPAGNGNMQEKNTYLQAQLLEQKGIIDSLQRQASDQWRRLENQEAELEKLRAQNAQLEQKSLEQNALIRALQRQLGGWAQESAVASKRLRDTLTKALNEDELRQWAADMKIPFDSLSGKTLPVLIISMLDFLERYGRLSEGLAELHVARPDIKLDQ